MRIPPNGGNFPTLGICCEEENNCYYFAPDAGAPCRDGSRRSPSTSTRRSSPQMLQVVRDAEEGAEPRRVPTFLMRGGGGRGGEGLLLGGLFHTRASPPALFAPTSAARSPTPSSPHAFWGRLKRRGAPARCCSAGHRLLGVSQWRGGWGGQLGFGPFRGAALLGARCCPRGPSPLPGWRPPSVPHHTPTHAAEVPRSLRRSPRGLRGAAAAPLPPRWGCSLRRGEPPSLPKAEGLGGREGERKELRTIFVGVGNGSSLVSPIYLTLSG